MDETGTVLKREDYYLKVITEAYFALANSRSPSNTKRQQAKALAKCHDLLASVVFGDEDEKDDWVVDTSHIGA